MSEEVKVAGGAKEKKEPEVGEMKKGDYMIHVFLQDGKNFKSPKGGETTNPLIEITCCDKKKYSVCKKEVGPTRSVSWGEHIFFEPKALTKDQVAAGQISIRVLNKGFLKDDLIGVYEFDLAFIYFMDKHAMFHQWIGLSNPESADFNEITCYLKLSVSVIGPGDEQVPLTDQVGPEKTDEAEIMMPASIKKEFKQIKFRFLKGEKFPQMDFGGTIDAYVTTNFFKKKLSTTAVTQTKNTHETAIEQEFWLPIQWPMASDRLVLKVYDQDKITDEIVGSMFFSLKDVVNYSKENGGILCWKNLYGSPLGCKGDNTTRMNENPECASTWKGRMLMHMTSFDAKSPEMKVAILDPDFKLQAIKQGAYEHTEFEIIAEIGTGICLPGKKKYKVRVAINDFFFDTKEPKECKENYCRWSERIDTQTFKGPYRSVEELDRVYVYLLEGDEPICFWKGQASEFTDPNPKTYRWLPLSADLAKGKVSKDYEAGMISIKMSINYKTKDGAVDFKKLDGWKKQPPKRLKSWKVRCFIFQCKDIPAADSDGSSDPYISLWNQDNKKIQTQVVEDNCNPIFFEALELYYDYDNINNDAPPVVFNIWDKDDAILDGDDYLGRCVVYLNDAVVSNDDTIPEPRWHDVKIGFLESDPPCGQMLCSFSIVEDDYTYKIPINYLKLTEQIEYKEFSVEVNVLGLRELESFGLMPVKKAFIKFNLRSLLPPEKAQAVTNIKTQPNAAGANPNINTIINFLIDLPVNPLFCPKLQCDVYDYVYKGLCQPLLGTFTISIGDVMHQQITKREEILSISGEIIKQLKARVKTMEDENQIKEESKEFSEQNEEQKQQQQQENDFGDRARAFDELATETQIDTSRLISDNQKDKQKLLSEAGPAGPILPQPEEASIFEEDKSAFADTSPVVVKSDGGVKSEAKSGARTPMGSPNKYIKKQTAGNIYKQQSKLQDQINQSTKFKILLEQSASRQSKKEQEAEQREKDKEMVKKEVQGSHKNILQPKYEFDDRLKIKREVNKPPSSLYMELGYNPTVPGSAEEDKKHYRKFFPDELENCKEIFKESPFYTVDIFRGQTRGNSAGFFSLFSKPKTDESGEISTIKTVGRFKGRLTITNQDDKEMFKATKDGRIKVILSLLNEIHEKKHGTPLNFALKDLETFEKQSKFMMVLEGMGLAPDNILGFLKEQSYQDMITRQLLIKTKCIVRLYVLEGYDFAQRDIGSFSDPYLKLKCGKKKFNERDNYQLDEPNPKFYKMYEFDVEFPGAPSLVIKAYDYDDLFGDDLIGKTVIDLDDRFFSPEWQQIKNKPIEYRELHHESSSNSQGVIKMWVEINNPAAPGNNKIKIWDVTPAPSLDYQIRLVVFDTVDVIPADFEGTSDVFIKAFVDDNDKKESDTHYRCMNGKASFNYRLLFGVKAPRRDYKLTVQVWDRDLFKSNDFIGETQVDLVHIFDDLIQTQKPMTFTKKYWDAHLKGKMGEKAVDFYDEDTFYVSCVDKEGKMIGKVRLGLSITTDALAQSNPVGPGRTEPNHSPFLPPPVGRISFTLNPFAMFNQMVGPELRRKIYTYCCLAACVALCIALIPLITGNLVSQMIMNIF